MLLVAKRSKIFPDFYFHSILLLFFTLIEMRIEFLEGRINKKNPFFHTKSIKNV